MFDVWRRQFDICECVRVCVCYESFSSFPKNLQRIYWASVQKKKNYVKAKAFIVNLKLLLVAIASSFIEIHFGFRSHCTNIFTCAVDAAVTLSMRVDTVVVVDDDVIVAIVVIFDVINGWLVGRIIVVVTDVETFANFAE